MSEEKFCSKCGEKASVGMYSLISDMCDDCYEKVNFYTPENRYSKEHIEREFHLPDNEYSIVHINNFLSKCVSQIVKEIRKSGKSKNKKYACMFLEFNKEDKIKELINNRHFEGKFSCFFTNEKSDLKSNFEDRNKCKSWIICEE